MSEPLAAKPCPFCGDAIDVENEGHFGYKDGGTKWGAVVCGCGALGPDVRTGYAPWKIWRESALKEWNQRA